MSKLGEKLFYDIEAMYIDGVSAKRIAEILECPIQLVHETLEEMGVADAPQEDFNPFDTINS